MSDDSNCKLAYKARQSQRLWDTFVPERNWTFKSPAFVFLAFGTLILYSINSYHAKSGGLDDHRLQLEEKRRLDAERLRSQRLK